MKLANTYTLISMVFVAACGGNTAYNGTTNNPPPAAGFDITPANGMQVAQVAYQSVVTSGNIAGLASSTGLTAGNGGNVSKPGSARALSGAIGSAVQNIPIGPTTLPCGVAGSLTISGNLANPLTLTAGDTIVADYDNCDDGFGEVIDGALDFIVDAFNGDIFTGVYDMTMTMDLINFQASNAVDTLLANGDGTATLNTLLAPYVEASVTGNSMTTDFNGSSETLTNYSSAQTFDGNLSPAPYTMSASGTLASSQLGGAVSYSTPVTFLGFDAEYPHTGELLVTGPGSSARLIAVDNVSVRIEIDSNGDGTVDDTINTTWAELEGI